MTNNTLLAIETSTHACSVALRANGELFHKREVAARRHGELLLPWVEALLTQAGVAFDALDAIAVSQGPGAFTGVRMGIAVAQGLAMAHNIPVVPVSSLAVCAHGAWRLTASDKHLVAFDARMGELYWGEVLVEGAGQVRLCHESVVKPQDVELPQDAGWLPVSDGWAAYPEFRESAAGCLLDNDAAIGWLPDAQDLLAIAEGEFNAGRVIQAPLLQPVYLRNNVAQKPKRQLA